MRKLFWYSLIIVVIFAQASTNISLKEILFFSLNYYLQNKTSDLAHTNVSPPLRALKTVRQQFGGMDNLDRINYEFAQKWLSEFGARQSVVNRMEDFSPELILKTNFTNIFLPEAFFITKITHQNHPY